MTELSGSARFRSTARRQETTRGDAQSQSNWSRPLPSPFRSSSRRPPCRSATGRWWTALGRRADGAAADHAQEPVALARSFWKPSQRPGPKRRSDDRLREACPQSIATGSDVWIPGSRARARAPE